MYRLTLKQSCSLAQQRCMHTNAPPNARQAGFGKLLLFLTPLAAAGGVVTYAKYDTKFRKYLEDNVPGASKTLKIALQEENPFKTFTDQIDNASKSISNMSTSITNMFGGSDSSTKPTEGAKDQPQQQQQKQQQSVPAKKQTVVEKKSTESTTKAATGTSQPQPVKKVEPAIPTDILELEQDVEKSATLAIKEYNKAISLLKSFNEEVRQVVDHAVENVDPSLWVTLKNKTSARDSAVETAEKMARDAIKRIEKCELALSKVATAANNSEVLKIRDKVQTMMTHITKAKDELYKEKDISSISEKYWRSVEKARNYFIDEMQSLFPGINLSEKKLKLAEDDLDLFITHAYSHVLAYQKELQRLQTDGELRLKRAIDTLRGDNDSEAIKAQLDYQLETERRKLFLENQKRILQIRADAEKMLRQQLKKQAEAHADHLNDAISMKETEMRRTFTRELEDKLAMEKANYKLQLAAMLGKMRGMDAALQARAEAERSAHQAQALWAACQALWATVRTGEPGTHWREQLRPLKNEIKAVSKVAEGDELVAVVLQNLPREAEERGVFPEDALRERFLNVERLARKLALIQENTASLPMYFMSYLQSLFILRPEYPVSSDELQNKQFDYSKLDTYDVLDRARYYVDRGDLLQALKYMNLLKGAPRKVASDWLKETRLLLETQQAANTLMAHAAASGLLYL